MSEKVKTSLLINRALWEEFKLKVGGRVGLRALSRAVEETVSEITCHNLATRIISV
ncbi:MAG: hypothetical protein LM590_04320 [Thermofilum sp.]|jgi:hypothetical protein|nr:hypothetical protein [Thermofilum sp.]